MSHRSWVQCPPGPMASSSRPCPIGYVAVLGLVRFLYFDLDPKCFSAGWSCRTMLTYKQLSCYKLTGLS